ncbi:MAG: phosphogluconate dehydrogenase (NAD(+)-dependent, decarboxylating) [Solirubrobacteraceae bacterium]
MELGFVGLGRMGMNMVRRLQRDRHRVVTYDRSPEVVKESVREGAIAAGSLKDLVAQLTPPRAVWVMVPAGDPTESTIRDLAGFLEAGDTVIDGGNSYFKDDARRARELEPKGIHYLDAGTSGGIWGLKIGYCLMVGGEREIFTRLEPIFKTLAPENGYAFMGAAGAGHYVKMIHNGIEYGLMAAYAEGLNILHHANAGLHQQEIDAETAPLRDPEYYEYEIDTADVAEVWRRGSVVASWLLDLTAHALSESPQLSNFHGRVSDSGEGRWTVLAAVDVGAPADVLSTALFNRFASRGEAEFGNRLLSAMRSEFGGHAEKPAGEAHVSG